MPNSIQAMSSTAIAMSMLEKNKLKISKDDTSQSPLVYGILDYVHRVNAVGKTYDIEQPPKNDFDNKKNAEEDISILNADSDKYIKQLIAAGKEKQILGEGYSSRLKDLKNDYDQYINARDSKIAEYKSITTDLNALRSTLAKGAKSKAEVQAAKAKLEAGMKKLTNIDKELTYLNTKLKDDFQTRAKTINTAAKRDAAVGLQGPQLPTAKK